MHPTCLLTTCRFVSDKGKVPVDVTQLNTAKGNIDTQVNALADTKGKSVVGDSAEI